MDLDPIFPRDGLLPIAAHAYTVSGIDPGECDTFDSPEFSSKFDYKEKDKIEVDPATCRDVWLELKGQGDVHSQKASEMLTAVMADSHVFGFVAAGKEKGGVFFFGSHFFFPWVGEGGKWVLGFPFFFA